MYKTHVNNGINYQSQLVIAGFLNHQQPWWSLISNLLRFLPTFLALKRDRASCWELVLHVLFGYFGGCRCRCLPQKCPLKFLSLCLFGEIIRIHSDEMHKTLQSIPPTFYAIPSPFIQTRLKKTLSWHILGIESRHLVLGQKCQTCNLRPSKATPTRNPSGSCWLRCLVAWSKPTHWYRPQGVRPVWKRVDGWFSIEGWGPGELKPTSKSAVEVDLELHAVGFCLNIVLFLKKIGW